MLTLCPRCATTFRVTPEQLRARQGRVRCGSCQAVFNALDTLIDEPPPAPVFEAPPSVEPAAAFAPAPLTLAPVAPLPETVASVAPAPEPAPEAVSPEFATPAWVLASTTPEPAPEEAAAAPEPEEMRAEPEPEEIRTEPAPEEASTTAVLPAAAPATMPAATEAAAAPPAATDNAPQPNLADRLKAATELEPPAPPRRRRWPWALGTAAAVVLLLFQAALRFRTELAVLHPETKPALVALCAAVGCQVSLPRRPEMLNIETSDLHPDGPGKLALTASLRNRAPFAQEYPYLELTLTDTGDQPLARRAIAPANYLQAAAAGTTGLGAGSELAINLAVTAPELNAAGYRLYVFYP